MPVKSQNACLVRDLSWKRGFAAYTQLSLWQIYSYSCPFRETNYEPELLLSFDTKFNVLGSTNRLFIIGLNHQSNGMGPDLSRSWNRIYIEFIAERGNFFTGLKSWCRIPEDVEEDDNPDIEDYLETEKRGQSPFFVLFSVSRSLKLKGNTLWIFPAFVF